MDAPRILLLGRAGQVGWELARTLAPLGAVTALGRAELDLADADAIRRAVRAARPALIVNAAAYTAVDRAEDEPDVAEAVNAIAPGILAEEAARARALLVHFSTDYVFDGGGREPYRETDPPAPASVYGASKLRGEAAVQAVGGAHLIFRTSWVYAARGGNFLRTILRLAAERDELRIVDDQTGAPTWSRMIAEATALVLARMAHGERFALPSELAGVYHLTAGGATTWCGFAQAILDALVPNPPRLVSIRTEEYPTRAARPRYSVLDNTRIRDRLGIGLPPWREQLWMVAAEVRSGR